MKKPYNQKDTDGNHLLDVLRDYEYEDPTLQIELNLQREGVQIAVKGRNAEDAATLLEYLYLRTRHLPGYAQDPDTYAFHSKEAELARQREVDGDTAKSHYAKVAAIKKRQAVQAVRGRK